MRFWCGSLLLALLVVLDLQSCVEGQHGHPPQMCCFSFHKGKMRLDQIEKYEVLSDDCPKPGVVFTRWAGNRVCADPQQAWVKEAMKQIDNRAES